MATLYEINDKIADAIKKSIDPETGEVINEHLSEELDSLGLERGSKIDSILCVIKNKKADAEMFAAEAEFQKKRADAAKNEAKRLTEYLRSQIEEGEKFSSNHGAISWRKSTAVKIDDVMKLPENFRTAEWKANKKAVGDWLKSGGELPGATLTVKQNMIVK